MNVFAVSFSVVDAELPPQRQTLTPPTGVLIASAVPSQQNSVWLMGCGAGNVL